MQKINNKYIKLIVSQALREDLRPLGDITTRIIANKKASGKIVVGQNCIVEELDSEEAFKILDRKIIFKQKIHDGEKVKEVKFWQLYKVTQKIYLGRKEWLLIL